MLALDAKKNWGFVKSTYINIIASYIETDERQQFLTFYFESVDEV